MVSSRKKSKERNRNRSQVRSEIESDENKNKKKKSSKGCYGKKSKKRSQSERQRDTTDSVKHEASAPSHNGEINAFNNTNRNAINSNNERNEIRQDSNKVHYPVETYNATSNRQIYDYEMYGSNSKIGMNPTPAPRKFLGVNDNYKTNSIQQNDGIGYDMSEQHNITETSYRNKGSNEYPYSHKGFVSYNADESGYRNEIGRNSQHDITEVIERKIITKGARGKNNIDAKTTKDRKAQSYVMGDNNEHFKRFHRSSIISKVSSSFSSNSSYNKNKAKSFQIYKQQNINDERSHSVSSRNNPNIKSKTHVTIEKSTGSLDKSKHVNNDRKPIPVLKANKSYNISFAMNSAHLNKNNLSQVHSEQKTMQTIQTKSVTVPKRKKSSKRIQTEIDQVDSGIHKQASAFTPLMKDVNLNERKEVAKNQNSIAKGNIETNRSAIANQGSGEGRRSNFMGGNNLSSGNNNAGLHSSYSYGYSSNNNAMNGNNNALDTYNFGFEKGDNNYKMIDNNNTLGNRNASGGNTNGTRSNSYAWDTPDGGDAVYTSESMVYKEWLEIEHPDGRREKRDYRKERNNEGDTSYIDILNGKILKFEKADWKTGEELIKNKKVTKKIHYEWRKDPETNEWVKYNSDTNEIIRRGDWKSGYEWYRNSKGKLVERHYIYIKNSDGKWVKSDEKSGNIVDYSNCSALKGHTWVTTKRSGYGKTKNVKWRKQEYEYVQNNKGKWIKQDSVTKRKLAKPSNTGWKEGKTYSMNKNGKIQKVRYVWQTGNDCFMNRVNKKTKEPVNISWMQGREVIMKDNNVVTNNYCWVKNGKNKWVKVDEETGKPLTNNIKSDKISTYNQSESKSKAYVSKVSKRTDNNKIVEENTKIEQNGGGLVKNTTTTIKY